MKDILLIWANSNQTTKPKKVNAPYHFIHFGEVASYLNNNTNGNIECLDIEANEPDFNEVIEKIIKNDYKMAVFYVNTDNLHNSINIANYYKVIKPSIKTMAYGEMPLYLPNFFENTPFDALVSNNCDQEAAILNYYNHIIGNKNTDDVAGVIQINENKLLYPSKKIVKVDSSEWGFADEKIVPIKEYFNMENREMFVCTISRGCPYNCPYCNAVLYYGKDERRRNANDMINFINNHDYKYYKFFAPNFTLNEKAALELCREIIENKKKIQWSCTTRPDLLENEELIKLMALSGCKQIAVGIESVNENDLKSINKRIDKQKILRGIELLREYGIEYKALIMFGVPNQTKESINRTLDFLYKNDLTVRATAYTPFYEMRADMSINEIARFDKRTYYQGIDGLCYGDFLKLVYDTKNYKKILKMEGKNV